MSILRLIIGGLFVGHGLQKLAGWFGGHGPDGTGQFFESIGLRPGRQNAIAAGAAEAVGGGLLASGLATTAGAAALSGTMISAIRHVHLSNGLWNSDGGAEFNLVLLAALLGIVEERVGPGAAIAQLGAGAIGSALISEAARRQPEPAAT